jgi:hypothetical protein
MATGGVITTDGKKIMLNRTYKDTPDYEEPTVFSTGIGLTTPAASDTELEIRVPITAGTVNDDGSNTGNLVGSAGGTTSTDNITRFKEGAGVVDATAQNLLANGSSVSKTWTIADLTAAGSAMTATQPFSVWIYMDETTCFDLLAAAGTVFDIRFRTNGDGATLYYQQTLTKAELTSGWNWINSGDTAVNGLTVGGGGAPSGALDEVVLIITTALAATTFIAGECVWDLLRQWADSDLIKLYESGYPTIDEVNLTATTRTVLTSIEANGFDLSEVGLLNEDGSPLLLSHDVFTAESKSDTDEFIFIVVDELV